MNRQLYSDLSVQTGDLKDWTPDNISFMVDGVEHDLMDYIGKKCLKENVVLRLPEKFSMDINKDDAFNKKKRGELVLALKIAAADAGLH